MKQQIPLPQTTSQNSLNRVNTAGVVFRNTNDLFVVGKRQIEQLDCVKRGLETDCQTAAFVSMKGGGFFPKLVRIQHNKKTLLIKNSGRNFFQLCSIISERSTSVRDIESYRCRADKPAGWSQRSRPTNPRVKKRVYHAETKTCRSTGRRDSGHE